MIAATVGLELRLRGRIVASAAAGLIVLTAIIGALFPSLGASVGKITVPHGVGDFIGGGDLAAISGWLRAEIVAVYGPVVFSAIAIACAAATLAGEEESRILTLVLAHPVPRGRLVLAKAAAVALCLLCLAVAVFAGMLVAVALAGGGIGAANLAAVSLHLWLFGLAVGALSLACGAATGQRAIAATVPAAIVLVMYLLNGLAPVSHATTWLRYLSVFHYYEGNDPIRNGVSPSGLAVLAALVAVLVGIAVVAFGRRDLRG